MAFKFPSAINYDGKVWHLLYAPDVDSTLPPNLEGATVQSMTCDPVTVPGRKQPIFITLIDILFPARQDSTGKVIGERRLKAFRTYEFPPTDPTQVKYYECAFYLAAPQGAGESVSQQFFNAIMGSCQEEAKAEKADTSWCDSLAKLQKQEAVCESGSGENREERASADGSV